LQSQGMRKIRIFALAALLPASLALPILAYQSVGTWFTRRPDSALTNK